MTAEVRTAELWPVDYEMRAVEADGGLVIEGYAAKFGVPSVPLAFPGVNRGRPFVEVLESSVFTRTINANPDLTLRYQHNMMLLPLGRTKAGTMSVSVDDVGLFQRTTLPDNEWGRPVYDAIRRRDIDGMSFRFTKPKDNVRSDGTYPVEVLPDGSKFPVRRIREARLEKELSITDLPAYPDTSVYARMLAEEIDADPDELADAFSTLRDPAARLSPDQRDLLVAAVNAHTDAPVIDVATVHKQAQMRERLDRLAG